MITVDRKSLVSALTVVQRALGRMPILGCVDMELDVQVLDVRGTDLETSVRVLVSVESGQDGTFRALTPCKALLASLRKFSGENVVLDRTDGRLRVQCDGAVAFFDEQSVEEYPAFPVFDARDSFVCDVERFALDLRRVLYAASTDETRYNLCSVYFDHIKERWVTTDGRRLACVNGAYAFGASMMLSRAFGLQLDAALGQRPTGVLEFQHDAALGSGGIKASSVRVELGSIAWISRVLEGEFPNVCRVIFDPTGRGAEVDAGEFASVLRQAEASTNGNCTLHFGAAGITVRNVGDVRTFQSKVVADVTESAIGAVIAFNVRYLREMAEHAGAGKLRLSIALDDRKRMADGRIARSEASADPATLSAMRMDADASMAIIMPMYV